MAPAAGRAVGTGFGAAAMYATQAQNRPMAAPGLAYYLLTLGGIIVSLAIIAAMSCAGDDQDPGTRPQPFREAP